MSPKLIDRDEKRKQIGRAALKHFAKDGFSASSMSRIANTAGVGKGTMYEYFSSKDELINFSLTLYVAQIEQKVASLTAGISDPQKRLRHYLHEVIRTIQSDPHTMGVMLAIFKKLVSDGRETEHTTLLRGMFQSARTAIYDMLMDGVDKGLFRPEAGQNARVIAFNIIAFIDGLWLHALADPKAFDLSVQADDFLDRLFYSIVPQVQGRLEN